MRWFGKFLLFESFGGFACWILFLEILYSSNQLNQSKVEDRHTSCQLPMACVRSLPTRSEDQSLVSEEGWSNENSI